MLVLSSTRDGIYDQASPDIIGQGQLGQNSGYCNFYGVNQSCNKERNTKTCWRWHQYSSNRTELLEYNAMKIMYLGRVK